MAGEGKLIRGAQSYLRPASLRLDIQLGVLSLARKVDSDWYSQSSFEAVTFDD